MRKFDSEGRATNWLNNVMTESANDHDNIRFAYHNDEDAVINYLKLVEGGKKDYRWRVDVDVLIGKEPAMLGCDVSDMDYQFEGRVRVLKPH